MILGEQLPFDGNAAFEQRPSFIPTTLLGARAMTSSFNVGRDFEMVQTETAPE